MDDNDIVGMESNLSELSKIVSYNISNTVSVLNLQINEKEIDLSPEFQRDFVWDIKRQVFL